MIFTWWIWQKSSFKFNLILPFFSSYKKSCLLSKARSISTYHCRNHHLLCHRPAADDLIKLHIYFTNGWRKKEIRDFSLQKVLFRIRAVCLKKWVKLKILIIALIFREAKAPGTPHIVFQIKTWRKNDHMCYFFIESEGKKRNMFKNSPVCIFLYKHWLYILKKGLKI